MDSGGGTGRGRAAAICVVRHGETDWNVNGVLQGWHDVELNERGRAQAYTMAREFSDGGFSLVYSSTLRRAMETAEIVAAGLRLPPPLGHDGLKERCFGAVEGVPKTELGVTHPMLLERILKRNPVAHFESGETMDQFADRVLAALREIGARHEGRRILAIAHGWVLDVVTRHIHGLPRSAILNMKRKNGEAVWVEATAAEIIALRAGDD